MIPLPKQRCCMQTYLEHKLLTKDFLLSMVSTPWLHSNMGQPNQTRILGTILLLPMLSGWKNHWWPHRCLVFHVYPLGWVGTIIRKFDQHKGIFSNMFIDWRSSRFQNPIINKTWQFIPRLLVWEIWKEINGHMFKNSYQSWKLIWHKLCKDIWEFSVFMPWENQDFTCSQ